MNPYIKWAFIGFAVVAVIIIIVGSALVLV